MESQALYSEFSVRGNFSKDTLLVPMIGVEDAQPIPPANVLFQPRSGQILSQLEPDHPKRLWAATLYGLAHQKVLTQHGDQ